MFLRAGLRNVFVARGLRGLARGHPADVGLRVGDEARDEAGMREPRSVVRGGKSAKKRAVIAVARKLFVAS